MSEQVTKRLGFFMRLKKAISTNVVTSLLITALTTISELSPEYFEWFFVLTAGYIIFDRVFGVIEFPMIKELDKYDIKKDVIEKQEYVRSQILLKRLTLLDYRSKINAQSTISLIKQSNDIEQISEHVDKFVKEIEEEQKELDSVIADIDIPFKDFLKNDKNIPSVNTIKSAENKFNEIEILQEK